MAQLTVRFDLSFGTRSLRVLMASGMIFSAATEVASESVTLTTYYPAPSGVYAQMITTGNTYLARDAASNGGRVGIGNAAPQYILDVTGTSQITGDLFVSGGALGVGTLTPGFEPGPASVPGFTLDVNGTAFLGQIVTTGDNGLAPGGSAATSPADIILGSNLDGGVMHDSSIMFWSATGKHADRISQSGDMFYLSTWDQPVAFSNVVLDASGNAHSYFGSSVQVPFIVTTDGWGMMGCNEVSYTFNGPPTNCPAGTYATMTSGVIAVETVLPEYLDALGGPTTGTPPQANMLCCNCPFSGCPL